MAVRLARPTLRSVRSHALRAAAAAPSLATAPCRRALATGALAPAWRHSRVAPGAAAAGWSVARPRFVAVTAEPTPNPDSVMFIPGNQAVLGEGTNTLSFGNKYDTNDSPLAAAIFKVKGVAEVLLAARYVTVRKAPNVEWEMLQPNVELVISQFYAAGLQVVKEGVIERQTAASRAAPEEGSLEARIIEVLDERVRPFVQQDGGDVEFASFDEASGVLFLRMVGSCQGCPKSSVTLQHGIKNLMRHYIPEVQDVAAAPSDGDEDLPRPH